MKKMLESRKNVILVYGHVFVSAHKHHVSNFDKKVLVWVKRYPSIADVPNDVTYVCYIHLYLYYIK